MTQISLTALKASRLSPFVDCRYPIRFSVLQYFGRAIEALALGELHRVDWDRDPHLSTPVLFFSTDSRSTVDEVLTEEGVTSHSSRGVSTDVIDRVRAAIDDGEPVMLAVDRYHQRFSTSYFERTHHLHFVLVRGYDLERGRVLIYDDSVGERGWVIEEACMGEAELREAHRSCGEQWREEIKQLETFVRFSGLSAAMAPEELEQRRRGSRRAFIGQVLASEELTRRSGKTIAEFAQAIAEEPPAAPSQLAAQEAMFRRQLELAHTRSTQLALLALRSAPLEAVHLRLSELERVWQRLLLASVRTGMRITSARLSSHRDLLCQQLERAAALEQGFVDMRLELLGRTRQTQETRFATRSNPTAQT